MRDAEKDNAVYLRHILDAVERIERDTAGGKAKFFESDLIQRAVLYDIAVIGEAARNISIWLKQAHPEVPWVQIISMRNGVVHEYFNIRLDLVWQAVETELPELKAHASAMLAELR